jgi:SAM-dependent methyltransferase
MSKYDRRDGIWLSVDNDIAFNYSDGDDAENYLLNFISQTSDLSIGSEEIFAGISDWPSLYHLSPQRADLLRPLAARLSGRSVLEIGSGCGAITRYLGETAGEVTALEGSFRRAKITHQRCRDLTNVKVFCDNFQGFEPDRRFDIITLIGVLEYSNLYIQAENPVAAMLAKIRRLLKPGGLIVIAIENKLGLKYLAGAPEDHLDKPYFGIEDKYDPSTVVTFGKSELKNILGSSGYAQSSFYYPFPDYKLPSVILTDAGLDNDSLRVGELLAEKLEYFQNHAYINYFSTTLAAEAFAKNQLLGHISNSFLVVASPTAEGSETSGASALSAANHSQLAPSSVLAHTYSTHRKKPFCKENIFCLDAEDRILVKKNHIYNTTPDPLIPIRQQIEDEIYYDGVLLSKLLIPLVSRDGWTLEDIRPWAQIYYTILAKEARFIGDKVFLDGRYADLTPFNILVKEGTDIHIFDQEWIITEPQPLYYIFFRGVRYSLGAISFFNHPADGVPLNLLELSIAMVNLAFGFTQAMLDDCAAREEKYFSPANLGRFDSFDCGTIRIRGNRMLESQLSSLRLVADLERQKVQVLEEELERVRRQADEKMQELERDKDWYIRTYEKRSLLGLIRARLNPSREKH